MAQNAEVSVPQVSVEATLERRFARRYRSSSIRYNVGIPSALLAIATVIGVPTKFYLQRKGFHAGGPGVSSGEVSFIAGLFIYTAFALGLWQGSGARCRAERNIAAGKYNGVKTGGAMWVVADEAARQDCVLPRAYRRTMQSVKSIPARLGMGNG